MSGGPTDAGATEGPAFVRTDRSEGVRTVRLDRPERLNAVSEELYADLEQALVEAAADADTRAVLLAGQGRAFCAGADLKAHADRARGPAERRAYVWAGQRVCRLLQRMPHPVVAAVQGYAIGAGAEIALSADLVVCAEDAVLAFPEVGLGTFVGGGVTHRLPRLVGEQRAKELLLLGRSLSGTEAVEWGLATRAVPAADVEGAARAIARKLAEQPVGPSRLAKEALGGAGVTSADEALAFEAEALLECMGQEDWERGVADFAHRPRGQQGQG